MSLSLAVFNAHTKQNFQYESTAQCKFVRSDCKLMHAIDQHIKNVHQLCACSGDYVFDRWRWRFFLFQKIIFSCGVLQQQRNDRLRSFHGAAVFFVSLSLDQLEHLNRKEKKYIYIKKFCIWSPRIEQKINDFSLLIVTSFGTIIFL